MEEDDEKTLLQKAGALLAQRSYSCGELQSKLMERYAKEQVEIALKRLESLNLLNDAEYAYNFALGHMKRQGWSPSKALEALLKRQVDKDVAESAIARIRDEGTEEGSLEYYLKNYCRKKGAPANIKELKRLLAHLRRGGFEEEDIFRALKELCPNTVSFETGE
jgi:SOS response regulatory protein OraA/RecX